MEQIEAPALWRKPPAHGYSLFPSLPRQRPTLQIRNVAAKRPDELAPQVVSVMKAAFRLPWKEGIARIRKQAEWLRSQHPDAAASLKEGLDEMFTINRLELSPALRRCLGSTNLIDSSHSGMRIRTRRVGRWKNADMACDGRRPPSSIPRKTSAEFWDIRISGCSRPNSTTWSLATIRQRWLN